MNLKLFNVALTAAVIVFASPAFADSVISDEDLAKINSWGSNRPSDELYLQYKSVFDNPTYYNQETGAVNWPANDGFGETPYDQTLGVGTWIDRFGSDYGTFVCPAGSPTQCVPAHPARRIKRTAFLYLKNLLMCKLELSPLGLTRQETAINMCCQLR